MQERKKEAHEGGMENNVAAMENNNKEMICQFGLAEVPKLKVMEYSYGLQIKQGSTIRKGNSKSFPMDPAPSTNSTCTRRGDLNNP